MILNKEISSKLCTRLLTILNIHSFLSLRDVCCHLGKFHIDDKAFKPQV